MTVEEAMAALDARPQLRQLLERLAVYSMAIEQVRALEPDSDARSQAFWYLETASERLMSGVEEPYRQMLIEASRRSAARDMP